MSYIGLYLKATIISYILLLQMHFFALSYIL